MKNKIVILTLLLATIISLTLGCTVKNNNQENVNLNNSQNNQINEENNETISDGEVESEQGQEVTIQLAEDGLFEYNEYDEFVADDSEAQVRLLFSSKNEVKDFKVLEIAIQNVDEEGKVDFTRKELYAINSLKPEKPLVLGMTFYGTLPTYAISYENKEGDTKVYAITLSGKDGSLQLIELKSMER